MRHNGGVGVVLKMAGERFAVILQEPALRSDME